MKTGKKRPALSEIGILVVCILAVIVSGSSIFTTLHMQKMASEIYEHPYSVSNEARATRSRLLDMRFFIMSMFSQDDLDMDDLQQTLQERYTMQYDAIQVITRQYLGPKESSENLLKAIRITGNDTERSTAHCYHIRQCCHSVKSGKISVSQIRCRE